MKKIIALVAALMATGTVLTGCGSSSDSVGVISVSNPYARATDEMSFDKVTKTYMTGVFMVLKNETDHDVILVGGSSEIAPMVGVHEVVDGVMQEKKGGLTLKPGESAELKPGGNHVMLMGMAEGLVAGTEATVTLKFADGQTLNVIAPVKVVNLEQEHYHSGEPSPSMSGM
jgi:copper(I)-binding protein